MKTATKQKVILGDLHIPFHTLCHEKLLKEAQKGEKVVLVGDVMQTSVPVLPIGKANKPLGPVKTKE